MGTAYYIVLEQEIAGLDTTMDGKILARMVEDLDEVAEELGVQPLSDFVSIDPETARELVEGEGEDLDLPPPANFSAADGLATVRALMTRPEAEPAMEDLEACERILIAAVEDGVGWHFEVDF